MPSGRIACRRLGDRAFYSRTLLPALREVQTFRDEQYVDLAHLGELLAARADDQRDPFAGRPRVW